MNHAAVMLIAALACITGLAAWVVIAERLDPPQRGNPPAVRTVRQHTARPGPDLDALTRGPGGTGWLEALPDDDPADITGVQPPSTCYLGMPSGQYVDELFDKHAEAQQ